MNLTLYHVTTISNIKSILDIGIIPELWMSESKIINAKYSDNGVHFYSIFPSAILLDYEIDDSKEFTSAPAVIKINIDVPSDKIIPEGEIVEWNSVPEVGKGMKAYNEGRTVVVLDNIDAKNIEQIYHLDQLLVNEYMSYAAKSQLLIRM